MTSVFNSPTQWSAIAGHQISSYVAVSMGTWACYDYLLNVDIEINSIWRRKWSCITACYIVLRYTGILSAVAIAVSALYNLGSLIGTTLIIPRALCSGILISTTLFQALVVASLQVVIMIRTRALYGRSKPVTWFLFVCFIISQAGNFLSTIQKITTWRYNMEDPDTMEGVLRSGGLPCGWNYHISSWVTILCITLMFFFEFVVLVFGAYRLRREGKERGIFITWRSTNLFYIVTRDNLVYFSASAIYLPVLFLGAGNPSSITTFVANQAKMVLETIILSLLGPYLVLNIRKEDAKDAKEQSTIISTLVFAFEDDESMAIERHAM